MSELKRLCPACGAANPMNRETCRACGGPMLSDLAIPSGTGLPTSWKRAATGLAVSATALALRVGLQLATDYLERKAAQMSRAAAPTDIPVKGRNARPQSRDVNAVTGPQIRAWGWGRRVRMRRRADGTDDIEAEEYHWGTGTDPKGF
jgi:hypothetical protein